MSKADSKDNAKLHRDNFRKRNPRADYFAGREAWAYIQKMKASQPDYNLQEAIDVLVIEGGKATFPERVDGKVTTR